MPRSKTSPKGKSASAPKSPRATTKKAGKSVAKGVEPITEGPYANSGPEYEARVEKGNEPLPEGTKPVITSPGSVTV